MIDAVYSLHTNPQSCGVAKFNHALAKRLKVPLRKLNDYGPSVDFRRPLLSLKPSEWYPWKSGVCEWWKVTQHLNSYELFLHDWDDLTREATKNADGLAASAIRRAWRVYAGDAAIAVEVRKVRPDVIAAFCPATVEGTAARGNHRVLVFGMAHKLNLPHFEQLKVQLDREHPDYTIELSTAVHEGSPWDKALEDSTGAMRAIFGDKLRVLGFLGDDALAKELQDCDAVAAYFTPALRANNTSAWAALAAGKKLYTNTDEYSPPLDVTQHSWERLVELIRA